MRLGTSTNLVYERPDKTRVPLDVTLRVGKAAGFTEFDFNSYDWSLEGAKLRDDDWESWITGIAELAEEEGLSFSQCHAYCYSFLSPSMTGEERELHEKMVLRSIRCAGILGAQVLVTHPGTVLHSIRPRQESLQANKDYFYRYLEQCAAYNLDIAIENQWDADISPQRKFGSTAEELVELIAEINDPRAGVCWDFEHGDLMKINQPQAIRYLGSMLKATHVSDHFGWEHPHIMPLFGKIDWQPIIQALGEVQYKGVFALEAHNYANKLPDELLLPALKLSHDIGEYLLKLGE